MNNEDYKLLEELYHHLSRTASSMEGTIVDDEKSKVAWQWAGAIEKILLDEDEERGDLSDCSYYRGVGICSYGCRDEPECQTGVPGPEGWPSERVIGPAAKVLERAWAAHRNTAAPFDAMAVSLWGESLLNRNYRPFLKLETGNEES